MGGGCTPVFRISVCALSVDRHTHALPLTDECYFPFLLCNHRKTLTFTEWLRCGSTSGEIFKKLSVLSKFSLFRCLEITHLSADECSTKISSLWF